MTQGSLLCTVCGARHYDLPEYVEFMRCLICGAPKSKLTWSSEEIYSDSNKAAMRGKGGKPHMRRLASGERGEKEEGMARKTKTEEIDDLVDDLDELEDEDLDEVEDVEVDEDDEDPDEAPKRKRTRKAKATKAKPEKTGIGTTEVAEAAGIEPRQLRMFLRSQEIQPRDDREGRYNWPSLNDPEVKAILKAIQKGELAKAQKEKLDELKERKAKKATTTKKRTKAAS